MAKAKQTKKEEESKTMGPEITNNPDRMDDAVDMTTLEAGEHKVRILQVNDGIDRNGNPYFQPRLEATEDPYAKDFTYFLGVPGQHDDAKTMNRKKLKIRDFCQAFGINVPPTLSELTELFKSGDMVGLEAWAVLKEKESEEYGMQNEIVRFIRPV